MLSLTKDRTDFASNGACRKIESDFCECMNTVIMHFYFRVKKPIVQNTVIGQYDQTHAISKWRTPQKRCFLKYTYHEICSKFDVVLFFYRL